jgi:hypothetical protein
VITSGAPEMTGSAALCVAVATGVVAALLGTAVRRPAATPGAMGA